jgi:hypothetical protein
MSGFAACCTCTMSHSPAWLQLCTFLACSWHSCCHSQHPLSPSHVEQACQFSRVVSWSASADPSSKARFVQTSSQKMRVYSPRSALLSVACLHSPRRLLEILQGIVERSYGAKYVPSMLAVSRAASTIDGTLGVCICNIFFLTSCWLLLAALLFFTPFCALDCALLFPLSVLLFFLLLML